MQCFDNQLVKEMKQLISDFTAKKIKLKEAIEKAEEIRNIIGTNTPFEPFYIKLIEISKTAKRNKDFLSVVDKFILKAFGNHSGKDIYY
jgi:hypothetical protein